jgi:uncharacterized RDD family membrane protein YckC
MNYQDETLNIDTPENVVFGYQIAGIGSRFLAALPDTVLITIIQLVVMLPILFFIGIKTVTDNLTSWVVALLSLLSFVFFWGYYIFFELVWNGQSPGKRLVGLRVVRRDGTPITLFEVLIRNLVRIVDLMPTGYGVGLVVMFIDSQSRRLGDLAAGTLVIHDRGPLSLEKLVNPASPKLQADISSKHRPLGFAVERITPGDLHLVDEYTQRRANLANRDALAEQILKSLCEHAGLSFENILTTSEESLEADEVLIAIAATVEHDSKYKEKR